MCWKVLEVKRDLNPFYLQQQKVLKSGEKWWKVVESGGK